MKDKKTTIPNDADKQRQELDKMGEALKKDPYEVEHGNSK